MKKILVTGGTGMVGQAIKSISDPDKFLFLGTKDVDLSNVSETKKFFRDISGNIDGVIHLAAYVGGSQINKIKPYDFLNRNLIININTLEACLENNIKKVVSILSTCIYPELGPFPLSEDNLNSGEPHPTTLGYSYSKRMLEIQSRAIRKQYGLGYYCLVPNNLYGPYDNFHIDDGHVIPSIIRKIYEAKQKDEKCVLLGDGSPIREFTYSIDFASTILEFYKNPKHYLMNVGSTSFYKIFDVAKIICEEIGHDFSKIIWEGSKSNEQLQKICDYEKQKYLKIKHTSLEEGLSITIKWFIENYPNIRGLK